jgi:hypothetical protein
MSLNGNRRRRSASRRVRKSGCRPKKEEIQRQEMEALKESVKRTQEVGEGTAKKLERVSNNISGLVQLM